tara:strand:+ start:544 stop:675 length:132 start_codon:yes stop_codon:yes gene_type:complete
VQNKNTANIFFKVEVLVLDENFAPKLAVKTLVIDTKKIINKFA